MIPFVGDTHNGSTLDSGHGCPFRHPTHANSHLNSMNISIQGDVASRCNTVDKLLLKKGVYCWKSGAILWRWWVCAFGCGTTSLSLPSACSKERAWPHTIKKCPQNAQKSCQFRLAWSKLDPHWEESLPWTEANTNPHGHRNTPALSNILEQLPPTMIR